MLDQKEFSFKDLIGIPHVSGETDCLWLVREVFKRYGVNLPEYNIAREAVQYNHYKKECVGEEVEKNLWDWELLEEPEVPCLVTMSIDIPGVYHHIGVCIGLNRFIHTTKLRGHVCIERLDNPLYAKRNFYRFVAC